MIQNAERTLNKSVTGQEIDSLITKIVKSPILHFKWLNTLSLLEHIGARKIHTSQTGNSISEMVLRHASEEARHAAFFKKLSLKVLPDGGRDFQKESLLAGYSAVSYFQKLDSCVARSFESENFTKPTKSFLCYLYVTKMIEERAGIVYEIYDRILEKENLGISISGIIKEEENHLLEMNSSLSEVDPDFEKRSSIFRDKEKVFFYKYFQTLKRLVF